MQLDGQVPCVECVLLMAWPSRHTPHPSDVAIEPLSRGGDWKGDPFDLQAVRDGDFDMEMIMLA